MTTGGGRRDVMSLREEDISLMRVLAMMIITLTSLKKALGMRMVEHSIEEQHCRTSDESDFFRHVSTYESLSLLAAPCLSKRSRKASS